MAGRFSVKGTFTLVDRMSRPLRGISGRLDRFIRNANSGFRGLADFVTHFRTAFLAVGAAIATAAAAGIAALRELINTGMEFDSVMATAAARFGAAHASDEFRALEETAINASRETGFTAIETANALAELGAAGATAHDAIQQLPVVLDTASAAGIGLSEAGDVITDVMSAFELATGDAAERGLNMARVADVMARGANSTSQSFEQLQGAIGNFQTAAHSAGLDIETTTALIGALADMGEKGERAGTRLAAMFGNLQTPERGAARELRRLHIQTRDLSTGAMLDAVDIVQNFEHALTGMTDAQRDATLARIFDAQGMRSMLLLLTTGSGRLRELRTDLQNASGSSHAMAEQMRDSGAGDVAIMTAEIEALKLGIWALIRGPVRSVIQAITEWVRANEGVIRGGFQQFLQFVADHMEEIKIVASGLAVILGVIAVLGVILSSVFIGLMAILVSVVALIIGSVIVAVGWLYENLASVASAIADAFREAWGSVVAFFREGWASIVAFFMPAVEFIVGAFAIIHDYAMVQLQPVFDLLAEGAAYVQGVFAQIAGFIRGVFTQVSGFIGSIWASITSGASTAFASFLEIVTPAIDQVRALFTSLGEAIAGVWHTVADTFMSIVGPVLGQISGVIDAVGNVAGNVRERGRHELEGGDRRGRPQVVSPQERVARSVSERTTTDRAEVTIRDQTGRAEQTRRPRNRGAAQIRLRPSGAM